MYHANAKIIDFTHWLKATETILLDFDVQDKQETLQRSESGIHNKQQQRQNDYYKKLASIIEDFE